MTTPSKKEHIINSAKFTVTNGDCLLEEMSLAAVRLALAQGVNAARYGRVLPLPLLLDLQAVLAFPPGSWAAFRRALEPNSYLDWLQKFSDVVQHLLINSVEDNRNMLRVRERVRRAHLPLLCQAWSKDKQDDLVAWADAYLELHQDADAVQQIQNNWCSAQNGNASYWRTWFPASRAEMTFSPSAAMWAAFQIGDKEAEWLHERFDHEAAALYLSTEDPPLATHQHRLIQDLQYRRQTMDRRPPESIQEPVLVGTISLSTLTLETEQIAHKIINNNDFRIGELSPTIPDEPVHVHLYYANTYASLVRNANNPADASTLQGFVALLLDDWRQALRYLPVHFHLHSSAPAAEGSGYLGRGGLRWKTRVNALDSLPPAAMVTRLFARQDWTQLEAAKARLSQDQMCGKNDWRCMCVLASDLPKLGFIEEAKVGVRWRLPVRNGSNHGHLPTHLAHLIILKPPDSGEICYARRTETELTLHSVQPRRRPPEEVEQSGIRFRFLREVALDVLLDQLTALLGRR